jgi:hypothetical protein
MSTALEYLRMSTPEEVRAQAKTFFKAGSFVEFALASGCNVHLMETGTDCEELEEYTHVVVEYRRANSHKTFQDFILMPIEYAPTEQKPLQSDMYHNAAGFGVNMNSGVVYVVWLMIARKTDTHSVLFVRFEPVAQLALQKTPEDNDWTFADYSYQIAALRFQIMANERHVNVQGGDTFTLVAVKPDNRRI